MNWEDKIGGMLFDYEEDTISQEEIIDAIKSLLKKQRENCAKYWSENTLLYNKNGDLCSTDPQFLQVIKNAPEPE